MKNKIQKKTPFSVGQNSFWAEVKWKNCPVVRRAKHFKAFLEIMNCTFLGVNRRWGCRPYYHHAGKEPAFVMISVYMAWVTCTSVKKWLVLADPYRFWSNVCCNADLSREEFHIIHKLQQHGSIVLNCPACSTEQLPLSIWHHEAKIQPRRRQTDELKFLL